MIELLLVMVIVSLFFPMMTNISGMLARVERFPTEVQDQIGLAQLRRFLNGCRIREIHSHQLVCENEKQWTLRCSDHHLFLSDGTIIVLEGVTEVFFEQRENEVWMMYERNHQWKEALISFA